MSAPKRLIPLALRTRDMLSQRPGAGAHRARREDVEGRRDQRERRAAATPATSASPANRISTAGGVADGNVARAELVRREARGRRRRTTSPTKRLSAPSGSPRRSRSSRPTIRKRCRRSDRSNIKTVNAYFDSTANLERRRIAPGRAARARAGASRPAISTAPASSSTGHRRQRARQQQRTVRVSPGDERELHAHRAHDGRHRIGLGGRRSSGLVAARRQAASAQRAIEKARLSRNPVAIEPGRYTVILEPQAVGDLVQLLAFALDARSADEGRSAFSKQGGGTKIGEKIVDERVTLFSDPVDPQILATAVRRRGTSARQRRCGSRTEC